ncbi:hypothetical protein ACA910_019765 [Epithemia clementina (nom. ined.)]
MSDSATISLHREDMSRDDEQREDQRYPHCSSSRSTSHESTTTTNATVEETRDERNHPEETIEDSSKLALQESENWNHIPGEEIRDNDIILGRGIGKSHHGNLKFRALVRKYKLRYLDAPKVQKPHVAAELVKIWRALKPPGRFLARKNTTNGTNSTATITSIRDENIRSEIWYDVGDKRAREKASMSLREKTAEYLPYLKMIRERQDPFAPSIVPSQQQQVYPPPPEQQQPHHAFVPEEQQHHPQRNSFWYQTWSPPHVSNDDSPRGGERRHYHPVPFLPPPAPRRMAAAATSSASTTPHHKNRSSLSSSFLAPAAGWRDYSIARNPSSNKEHPAQQTPREYHQSHPAVGDSGGAPHLGGGAPPRSFLEVQQQTTIRRLSSTVEEQRRLIESLKCQIAAKCTVHPENHNHHGVGGGHHRAPATSSYKLGVTPISSQPQQQEPTSAAAVATLILSPVPYSTEHGHTDDENEEEGLENYENILMDCFRTSEDVTSSMHRSRMGSGLLSANHDTNNKEQQESCNILHLTPLQPRSLLMGKERNINHNKSASTSAATATNENQPTTSAVKNQPNQRCCSPPPPSTKQQQHNVLQPLRRSVAWDRNSQNRNNKGQQQQEETFSSPPRWKQTSSCQPMDVSGDSKMKKSSCSNSPIIITQMNPVASSSRTIGTNRPMLLPRLQEGPPTVQHDGTCGALSMTEPCNRGLKRTQSGSVVDWIANNENDHGTSTSSCCKLMVLDVKNHVASQVLNGNEDIQMKEN